MAKVAGDILISQEYAYTSSLNYYVATLHSISRSGDKLNFTIDLDITIGAGDGTNPNLGLDIGSGNTRTAFVYDSNGNLLGSKVIKNENDKWVVTPVYENGEIVKYKDTSYKDYMIYCTATVGYGSGSLSGCYIRIKYSDTKDYGGVNSCYWNGSHLYNKPAGNTFSIEYDSTYSKVITLSFDPTEGKNGPRPMAGTVYSEGAGYTFTIPSVVPVRTGYTCDGWSRYYGGEIDYYPGDTITVSQDTTLYAHWQANFYSFNLNILSPEGIETYTAGTVDVSTDGGLNWDENQKNEPNEGNSFYPYGTAFKFKDFKPGTGLRLSSVDVSTDGGLTWSGATQNADGTWSATQGAAELIVKFHTEKNDYGLDVNAELDGVYTLTPDSRYGTFSVKINGTTVAENVTDYFEYHPYGSTYEIFKLDVSKGRRYLGCNLSEGESPSGTIPDRDIEVILQFETIRYSIGYVLGGGTNPGNASTSYTVDDAVTLPTPTRSGYEFTGWRDEGGSIVTGIPAGSTGDKTFIATWKPKAEMFAKDGDHYRRGLAKVKHDGKWRDGATIYKKINGHWKAKN